MIRQKTDEREKVMNAKWLELTKETTIKQQELEIERQKLIIEKLNLQLEGLKSQTGSGKIIKTATKQCFNCKEKIDEEAFICPICGCEDAHFSSMWGNDVNLGEKKVVFQIEIETPPDYKSPFVRGINTIVIPASTFYASKLGLIIRKEEGYEYYESDEIPECLKNVTGSIYVEKRGNPNDWIEVLIVKKGCDPLVAEEILNFLLTELMDETAKKEILI